MFQSFKISDIVTQIKSLPGPVVSVGSGNGYLEAHMKDAKVQVVCVDPAPESFRKYDAKWQCVPDYPTADKVPANLHGATLFLGWATPNGSSYDYDAIKTLKPKAIAVVFEREGGAGGDKFHEWLYTQTDYKTVHVQTAETRWGTNEFRVLQFAPGSEPIKRPDTSKKMLDSLMQTMMLMNMSALFDKMSNV